ncbi:MAG TPA: (Fe-S)-binding protein [Thermoplasmata archaeon]|nr:(Fe-S)-binding protein [Thermoplasmata archaeon]
MPRLAKMPPIQEDIHACTMCGYCVPVCPAYQEAGWEGASPRGRVFALRQYEMRGPLDLLLRRQVKPGEDFARNTWECTGCGACEEVCPVDIPFDTVWDDVKEWMVNSGYERKELEPYLVNVRETHNLFGKPAEERGAWIPSEAVQSSNPEVLYWVGCVASYERQQIARAVVKILNAAKVPYRILGKDEWCSGAPLARMGYQETTKKELMPHNVNAVEETGAKVLVTACAECYRAFARDYKRWGGNPPYSVFHISHYVEKLIREKRITFTKPLPQKIAFHDACHMSRVAKVYEPPRQALKFIRDLKVLEILPHHEDALCSGAGGGFPAVFPEQAAGVAQRRLDAAEDTGATTLVTTCPHAEMHFEGVARSRNMTLSIVDLAEMLANAL